MLTIEIYERLVTWPEDFALIMIKHYENHGVPVIVHKDCINTGRGSKTFGFEDRYAAIAGVLVNICCHEQ